MSKRITIILLTVVLNLSAYASPTYAASTDLTIAAVHTGVTGGATQEFIVVHNNGAEIVDITNWCLRNKSEVLFYCFMPLIEGERAELGAYGSTTIVSKAYAALFPAVQFPAVYEPASQSSGSLVGSNDKVALIDAEGQVITELSWSTTVQTGMMRQRPVLTSIPFVYDVTTTLLPVLIQLPINDALVWVVYQPDPPDQPIEDDESEVPPVPAVPALRLTEIFPNADGSDEGHEFIEIMNVGTEAVDTSGLLFETGVATLKRVPMPSMIIAPGAYAIFSDTDAGFSLVNTTGQVKVLTADGTVVDVSFQYESPKDDAAWALIGNEWQYTTVPTPGMGNVPTPIETLVSVVSTPTPCRADQYRSPETHRCRKIATATTQKSCAADQYRSVETGRCRKIVTQALPAPCKAGWERNKDTGRCRKTKAITAVDYSVLSEQTTNNTGNWYWLWAAGAIGAAVLLYAAWEWRFELKRFGQKTLRRLHFPP